jgi:hypothetical protein
MPSELTNGASFVAVAGVMGGGFGGGVAGVGAAGLGVAGIGRGVAAAAVDFGLGGRCVGIAASANGAVAGSESDCE